MDEKGSHISTGVFFIGLGLLFLTGWWWPGIMFVLAAAILAPSLAAGESLRDATAAWWLIGIGVVFGMPGLIGDIASTFWDIFPLILVAIGLFMLFGGDRRPKIGKRKKGDDIHQV